MSAEQKMDRVWASLEKARKSGNFHRIQKWEKKMETVRKVCYPWNEKLKAEATLLSLKKKIAKLDLAQFKWEWCGLCHAPFIRCPQCGNNCCNATYGRVDKEGKPTNDWKNPETQLCPTCPSAYDVQHYVGRTGKSPSRNNFPDADEKENRVDAHWDNLNQDLPEKAKERS